MGGRGSRSSNRPTKGLFTPVAKPSPQRVRTSQVGGSVAIFLPLLMSRLQSNDRHTVEAIESFANDMNELVEWFSEQAKSKISKFMSEGR